ncbi:MAG: tetratricopeptide repeat protein [Acidobacteriota bacterium]|nr:tetratricopeptide repeat protein [Acidobacteriota bacterium]
MRCVRVAAVVVALVAWEAGAVVAAQTTTEILVELRERAEQGDADAQAALGFRYASGRGVAPDLAEAIRWYSLAADQGHVRTQYNLGVMYRSGRGVPQDEAEAARWFRLAAEQGYDSAQYNLGIMYDTGKGVPLDQVEAVRWFRLAAEQGHVNGMSYLGAMYGSGSGVDRDYRQAYMWRSLAASRDTSASGNIAAEARDALAGRMTAIQLAEAKYLVREWEMAHPDDP